MSRSVFGILVATLGIALSSTPAAAQFSSSVQGIVADQSGAVMPGVTVTARNLETQVAVSAVTNETGVYRLSSLAPGRYEVLAEISGFQPSRTEVRLETAQTAGVNLTLLVAGASEQVSVVGTSSEVFNPAETRVQTTIRTETLQELPLQGRNFLGLVALGSGITGHGAVGGGAPADAPDNFSTEKTVEASGNGRNQSGNQFTLDGLNVTSNILQGTANLSPNPDSVQEVAIQTNTFSVENGRGSSVQVAITTKSGTNDYHGTGSYFFTNEQLRARTLFTTKYEPFSRHDMSATFGGPIWKNRTFFFGSVQPLRSRISQATSVITFETPEFVDYARRNYPNTHWHLAPERLPAGERGNHRGGQDCRRYFRQRLRDGRGGQHPVQSADGGGGALQAEPVQKCDPVQRARRSLSPRQQRSPVFQLLQGRPRHRADRPPSRLLRRRQQQHERVSGKLAAHLLARAAERIQLRSDSCAGQRG